MWIWEKAHNLISDYLNTISNHQDFKKEKLLEHTFTIMDHEFNFSKNRDYSAYDKDNKFWLSEHYYQIDIDQRYKDAKIKLEKRFDNFLNSSLHEQIVWYLHSPNQRYIEPKEPDFEKMKVLVDNVPELLWITLWANPDFAVIVDSNKYIIYDWKTGRVPSHQDWEISNQLKAYAYKLLLNIWMEKIDDVEIFAWEVYLEDMSVFGGKIQTQDIMDIQDKIIEDVALQKTFIQDGDIQKNMPINSMIFQRTDNKKKCHSCTYRKICDELKNYEDI